MMAEDRCEGLDLLLSDDQENEEENGLKACQPLSSHCSVLAVVSTIKQSWFVQEAKHLVKLAIPIILTLSFQQLLLFVSTIYIGHITGRPLELDAAGLALTVINIAGVSIGVGLSSAAETLFSQTYGFKNYKRVGVVLQRGILILSIAILPMLAIWLNAESFLLLLQQPPCVARITADYVKIFCLALPFIFLQDLLQMYLQAQSIVWIFAVAGLLANFISAAMHAVLLFAANLGVIGASISMVIAYASMPVMVLAYTWARGLHKKTWGGWSWDSLREWGQFVKLAIPGLLMTCIEWWSFEIATFVTGSIDKIQLATNSVLIALLSVVYMLPLGLGISATIRVGNELGAGNPLRAKRAAFTAVGIMVFISIIMAIVLGLSRHTVARIFTSDQQVIDEVAKVMYVVCPLLLFDQAQVTISGVLRGCGRQALGALVNLICYYVIGLPIGVVLALVAHMGTLGFWIGLSIAATLQSVTFSVIVIRTNWEHQSQRAMKNAQDAKEKASSESHKGVEESTEMNNPSANTACEQETCNEDSDDGSSDDAYDTETELLIEVDGAAAGATNTPREHSQQSTAKLKLLLFKSIFFIGSIVLLVAGGVASQYHPPVDYDNCTQAEAVNQSIVITISDTM